MEIKKPEIKYSDPVEEIMGNPPGKILRLGTFVIFIIFILFILFTWFIKYPDLIPSPVEITTENPPVTLVSKIDGPIKQLDVANKSRVIKGQVLAVMETAASYREFEILKEFADTTSSPLSIHNNSVPELTELGELQIYYSTFQKNLSDYNNFVKNDYYRNKILSVNDEIKGTSIYIDRLKESEKLYSENLELDIKRFRRDSALFKADKTIPDSEYEKSRQAMIRQRLDLQNIRLQLSAKNIEQTTRQQLLKEYSINRSQEIEKLSSTLDESLRNLKAQISMWEITYLLISPISGTVTFTKYWSVNQSVNKDEAVLTIVPNDPGNYIGRIYLKMERSGKVQVGQRVNIKLSSFPYLEYGMVLGIIKTKSLVPSGDAYVIEIELPYGLKTLYNRQLDFTQNMQGTAEIITEDMRLLQKIVNPFRYLLSKNKR
jgi:multidrug efflux pump subunit AcrA (membrane-fusion protein)